MHTKQEELRNTTQLDSRARLLGETGEFTQKTLSHEGNEVREFYAGLEGPVVMGIGAM
jgi:hypothetical protein